MDSIKNKSSEKKNIDCKELNINENSVRILARLLEETHLTEIEYQVGTQRIRVARSGVPLTPFPGISGGHTVSSPPHLSSDVLPTAAQGEAILSPMVGTAYLAPEPGAQNFIKSGDSIKKGDILLIIEAMKVMNPIRAPRDGKILDILVTNIKPVEFGETLLFIE